MAVHPPPSEALEAYVHRIQRNLSSGIAREQTHRPALANLIEDLDPTVTAFNDPKHIEVGAPDFTVRRDGRTTDFPVGWVETKDIGENLDQVEKSDQMKRYLGLPNLILTDYLEFRWYIDGKRRLRARLGTAVHGKLKRDLDGGRAVIALLGEFTRQRIASVATPQELAVRMAKLAHIIREILLRAFETENPEGRLHLQFDRMGRKLSSDEIDQYQKIVVVLAETIRLTRAIDALIPSWPLA